MIKILKFLSGILIVFTIYKFYLLIDDIYISKNQNFDNLSDFLYLISALIMLILLIFSLNLFLHLSPFFSKANFSIIKNKDDYQKTLVASKSFIFNAYKRADFDILECVFWDYKKINPYGYLSFNYYDIDFLGVYVRVKKNIDNDFNIFASEKLLKLYYKNGFELMNMKPWLSDNVEFNKKFTLYPKNTTKDLRFLNPKKLANIVTAAKNINKKFSIIYKEEYLEIYIHNFFFSSKINDEYESIIKIIKEFNEIK